MDARLVLGPFFLFYLIPEQSLILKTMLITQWLWVKMKHTYPFSVSCAMFIRQPFVNYFDDLERILSVVLI